ncbi:unnamed protein product [Symbiodinium sp. CCMP2456]|nr:unnamed protein product [Symbiodinium sp. CCMP2456]
MRSVICFLGHKSNLQLLCSSWPFRTTAAHHRRVAETEQLRKNLWEAVFNEDPVMASSGHLQRNLVVNLYRWEPSDTRSSCRHAPFCVNGLIFMLNAGC